MCGIFLYIGKKIVNDLYSGYSSIQHRGPDNSCIQQLNIPGIGENIIIGFHRLKIMDVSNNGNQPFSPKDFPDTHLICNGEIYNFNELKKSFELKTTSESDCEVIPYLYHKVGIMKTASLLDGVFSFVLIDRDNLYIVRDPIGVRPLFYCKKGNELAFSSEAKALTEISSEIFPFPPGNVCTVNLNNGDSKFEKYYHYNYNINFDSFNKSKENINFLLKSAIKKRLNADRKMGVFISGGVDSSVVAGIMRENLNDSEIESFSIGLKDSPDLENAKKVASYLKTKHHEVNFTLEEGINILSEVIYHLESYDITTIRASVPQYLLSKYIKENTDVKVILSGEGADELFGGYLYFHYSPSNTSFVNETERLVRMLHQFDVLRTDRTTAAHGLEVRVPFLDKRFVDYVLSLPPEYKNPNSDLYKKYGSNKENINIEKYILRDSFEKDKVVPNNILWRKKDAFSDAVGYNWVDAVKEYASKEISDEEFLDAQVKYPNNTPNTKEGYLYRKIFEEMFINKSNLIDHYWMPKWLDSKLNDPSATYLGVHGFRSKKN